VIELELGRLVVSVCFIQHSSTRRLYVDISQEYWLQIKNITVATPPDAGIIQNISIGKEIPANGKPGQPNYQPGVKARSLT